MIVAIITISNHDILLPLLVFAAETTVLTLATLRTIFVAKGRKVPSAILGFFEVCVWLFAIGQVMQNLGDLRCAIAFAAGFSLGNFLGVLIEQKLAIGNLTIQVTIRKDSAELVKLLRWAGFGVTKLNGHGATGPVEVVYSVIERKDLPVVARIIERAAPGAFYSVHNLQSAAEGVFRQRTSMRLLPAPLRRIVHAAVGATKSRSPKSTVRA